MERSLVALAGAVLYRLTTIVIQLPRDDKIPGSMRGHSRWGGWAESSANQRPASERRPSIHIRFARIAAGHQRQGLAPAERASRRTLIRRLSLDLRGVPPTPAEVEAFLDDVHPAAWERLVERCLASPHYGERWDATGWTWPAGRSPRATRATIRDPLPRGIATMSSTAAVRDFACRLRGDLIGPTDTGYEEARQVYNAQIDRRPRLIVRCADVADVMAAVRFACQENLLVSVRGGSHNVAGLGVGDGGLVIDLSRMKGIRVDPLNRTARAEGGCTWGDLDHATYPFGLAAPGGVVSTTGIAGLTLGGGLGYLTRLYGLSCDTLLSADVVTADAQLRSASSDRHEDSSPSAAV